MKNNISYSECFEEILKRLSDEFLKWVIALGQIKADSMTLEELIDLFHKERPYAPIWIKEQ